MTTKEKGDLKREFFHVILKTNKGLTLSFYRFTQNRTKNLRRNLFRNAQERDLVKQNFLYPSYVNVN